MKSVINIIESILLAITIFLVMSFFTLGNRNFYYHEFDKYKYYDKVYKDIKNELNDKEIKNNITIKDVKEDINKYVKNSFNMQIVNRVKEDKENIYVTKITFDNKFKDIDVDLIKNIVFISALIMIAITGIVFKKTKEIHSLKLISILSSILIIITFGVIKLFVNIPIDIINKCFIDASYYLLFISVLIICINITKAVLNKLK